MTNGTAIFRPKQDVGYWNIIGGAGSAAAAIARPVSQPDPVDASSYIWAGAPGAATSITYGDMPAELDASQLGQLWFYANTGTDTRLFVEAVAAGSVLAELWVPPGSGFAWHSVGFPQAAAVAVELVVRFTAVGGGDSNVRAAYLQLATSATTGGGDPRVRVVGPTDKVRPQDPQVGTASIEVTAAGNEIVPFQVVVTAIAGDIAGFTAAVEQPLVGRQQGRQIPTQNVSLYRVSYVTIQQATFSATAPGSLGRWPDILIPKKDPVVGEARNAFPITIPAGENRIAWVEIQIPAGLPTDDYIGSVHVTGAGLDAHVPITISVLPFELPVTSRLPSAFIAGMDQACAALDYHVDSQGWDVLAMFILLGLNNYLTVPSMLKLLRSGGDDERPNFERILLPLITGTDPRPRLTGARMTSIDVVNGGSATELAAWRDEANAHGFADRVFVYDATNDNTSCDEIAGHPGRSWNTCRTMYVENVLSTWPQAPVLLTASINDVDDWEADPKTQPGPLTTIDSRGGKLRLTVVIDEMYGKTRPYQGNQRGNYTGFLGNPNHSLWLYSSCDSWGCGNSGPQDDGWAGGYAIDEPGARARAMAWLSYRFQAPGELYYDTTAQMTTAWRPGGLRNSGGNGDGTLFYPGTPHQDVGDNTVLGGATAIPLESIRLKHALLGHTDWEYLTELANRGGDAQAIAEKYFPQPFGLQATDATFNQARQEIVAALRSLL